MKLMTQIIVGAAVLSALAGCVETSGSETSPGGIVAPPGMVDECIRQVRVGQPDASISTRPPITAGPDNRVFVGMTVDGASWGCRIEDDGSYTAFSQFAN
ncbi:hypothetical protein KUV62_11135 [Salipiger bermudensis]|uniref:hypothetical protein n=1 Tax=Salipiger bermudensis TaxID=344736 RepID=UPI001C991972|nr:hypothetical protein [Salipiger bermudensis]MBY6004466.1 hypothetical protein [Salipiger bermudensis]